MDMQAVKVAEATRLTSHEMLRLERLRGGVADGFSAMKNVCVLDVPAQELLAEDTGADCWFFREDGKLRQRRVGCGTFSTVSVYDRLDEGHYYSFGRGQMPDVVIRVV